MNREKAKGNNAEQWEIQRERRVKGNKITGQQHGIIRERRVKRNKKSEQQQGKKKIKKSKGDEDRAISWSYKRKKS